MDASEQGAYEHVMKEAGWDPARFGYHGHEVEYHGHHADPGDEDDAARYAETHHSDKHHHHHRHQQLQHEDDEDAQHHHHEEEEEEEEWQHHRADRERYGEHDPDEEDDDDEEHLASALEALMERLERNDSVVHASNETIESWEMLKESSLKALSDTEQEVDLDRINKRIALALSVGHTDVPPFNASEHGSALDFLSETIQKAKLAPYREELLGLLDAWENEDVKISTPLKRIEELIDDGVLEPDVLILHGDYEHYRYDD